MPDGKNTHIMKITGYEIGKKFNMTIAVIADTHNKPTKRMLALLSEIKPDVICLVGDMVHKKSIKKSKNTQTLLKTCVATAPTLYSLGNHDYFMDEGDLDVIRDMGVTVLDNSHVTIGGVIFGGFPSLRHDGKKKKAESLKWIKEFGAIEGYKVLLCHHPEYYDRYDVGKYCDLVLAGHVHGGHVRLFGRGLFSSGQGFLPKYSKGLYDGKMIVSAGLAATGTILPRIFNEQEILKVRI